MSVLEYKNNVQADTVWKNIIRNKWFVRCVLFLGGVCIALILAEVAAALVMQVYDINLYSVTTSQECDYALNWPHEEWAQLGMQSSKTLGYEPIPNKGYRNSFGLIGEEISLQKGSETVRILFVGDSVTEQGYYVNYLAEMLDEKNSDVEILNAGVTGYNTRQEVEYIRHKGLSLDPDIIIVGFVLNDFDFTPIVFQRGGKLYYFGRSGVELFGKINVLLFKYSQLYRFIIFRLGYFNETEENYQKAKEERVELPLITLKNLLDERDIPFIVVLFAYPLNFQNFSDEEIRAYEDIKKILHTHDIDYVDLKPYFSLSNIALLQQWESGHGTGHPNEQGHRIAATAIYEFLYSRHDLRELLEI